MKVGKGNLSHEAAGSKRLGFATPPNLRDDWILKNL
jgi:hypothetical protein